MLQGSSRFAFRDPSGTCIFRYFQEISIYTLDNLYDFNRDEAYASCVSVLPFKWGKHVTPLSIADDACAMKFMGHSCSQTFLNLVWLQYMDLDTAHWKVGVRGEGYQRAHWVVANSPSLSLTFPDYCF